MKKYYFILGFVYMNSFLLPGLTAAESVSPKDVTIEKKSTVILEERLASFVDFSKNLHKQGLLDGEIFITRNGKILLDLQSKDIAPYDSFNGPQFMIGSVSKQFFAVALLKSLYESNNSHTEELKIEDVQKRLHIPISEFLPERSSI